MMRGIRECSSFIVDWNAKAASFYQFILVSSRSCKEEDSMMCIMKL